MPLVIAVGAGDGLWAYVVSCCSSYSGWGITMNHRQDLHLSRRTKT